MRPGHPGPARHRLTGSAHRRTRRRCACQALTAANPGPNCWHYESWDRRRSSRAVPGGRPPGGHSSGGFRGSSARARTAAAGCRTRARGAVWQPGSAGGTPAQALEDRGVRRLAGSRLCGPGARCRPGSRCRRDDQPRQAALPRQVWCMVLRHRPERRPAMAAPATALALTLASAEMPRPFTYKLATSLVAAAGSGIAEVRITKLIAPVFHASVIVASPPGAAGGRRPAERRGEPGAGGGRADQNRRRVVQSCAASRARGGSAVIRGSHR
jgi:Domain of unknown function (DUF151)